MLTALNGDRVYQDGDSISDPAFQYQIFALMQLRFCAKYGGNSWVNTAVNGSTLTQIQARVATNVPKFRPTIFVGHMGVNDPRTGADLTTVSVPKFTSILDLTAGAGIRTYIAGPALNGEKSDGSNPTDAALLALDNAMADVAARYSLCTYRSLLKVFRALELVTNLPPPGTASGFYCRPDPTPGVHFNSEGRRVADSYFQQDFILS